MWSAVGASPSPDLRDAAFIRWAPCVAPGTTDQWFLAGHVAVNPCSGVVRAFSTAEQRDHMAVNPGSGVVRARSTAEQHDQGFCWVAWCQDGRSVVTITSSDEAVGGSLQLAVTDVVSGALTAGPVECLMGLVLGDSPAFVTRQCSQRMAPSGDAILVQQAASVLQILELPSLTVRCPVVTPPHLREGHHVCAAVWCQEDRIVLIWTAEGASLTVMVHESATGRPERMFSLQAAGHPGRIFEFLELVPSPTHAALAIRWQMSTLPGLADGDRSMDSMATALLTFRAGSAVPAMLYRSTRFNAHDAGSIARATESWCRWGLWASL